MGAVINSFLAIVVLALTAGFCFIGQESHFLFDPEVLHAIGKEAANPDLSTQEKIDLVVTRLNEKYPGHVNMEQEWVLNNAGGAMGQMYLMHSSLSEYVIIFMSTIGTEGHTGRFWATDYFVILEGEQTAMTEGSLVRETYKPGEMHILPAGSAQAYKIPEHCVALEYARGNIPSMLPFGIADVFTSTLDFVTLAKTFWLYGKSVTKELMLGKI